MSGHVLRAITLPITIVAAVAFPSPVPAMLRLGAIALFVAVAVTLLVALAIAIAMAAIIIALFDAHWCALSPPTAIRIGNDGRIGSSLVAAGAAWRQQRR